MTKKDLHPKNPNNQYLKAYSDAVKQGQKIQQVIPHSNGWAVKKVSSDKASGVFKNKDLAISRACKIAKNQRSDVLIHNKSGKISKRIPCRVR
ncbi:MAG: DUF2188 domain-containing protein [Candidatus Berkelbacteria bacterium]|nr:DUF2188 domain-containing protein [Candidatus Berkelbacteria bacterium]